WAAPARLRTLQCSRRFPCTRTPAERKPFDRFPLAATPEAGRFAAGCDRFHIALHHLSGGLREEVRVHESVEPPVEDRLRVPHLEVGPVVFDQLVRVQHVGADLTPEADVLRGAALAGELRLALLLLELGQSRTEDAHGSRLV